MSAKIVATEQGRQTASRQLHKPEVAGSTPAPATHLDRAALRRLARQAGWRGSKAHRHKAVHPLLVRAVQERMVRERAEEGR